MTALVERLGFPPGAKVAILHAGDLGLCHSANVGVYDALRNGLATSASLMVPAPWAREAAAHYRGEDVGVQLTLNATLELYRWGPVTLAPSLLGGDGGFPRTMEDVWDHADLDEVRRECRAQIERAIVWGFDVSHLDTQVATLQLRPEFFDVYLELAEEFGLPLRLLGRREAGALGFPAADLAADAGVIVTDDVVRSAFGSEDPGGPGNGRSTSGGLQSPADALEELVAGLSPGVTEVQLQPAVDSDELRALAGDWPRRAIEHAALCDPRLRPADLERRGVHLIGFRALRALAARDPSGRPLER
ncbi:MAG TPA: polysaccharide deacetylase family protein [Acidimicrobiales bacterium]